MPVLAPEGTAARKRPSVVVMSHSTVGLPRESKICSEPARAHSVSHTRVAGRRPCARLHLASMDGGDLGHGWVGSESEGIKRARCNLWRRSSANSAGCARCLPDVAL